MAKLFKPNDHLLESIRQRWHDKLLDWAENLPPYGWGSIFSLQQVRRSQRQRAKDGYGRSRPPAGVSFDYISFRLMEMYHLEDFDQLQAGMFRLLSMDQSGRMGDGWIGYFTDEAKKISGSSWRILGYIVRDMKGRFFGGATIVFPDLPSEVDYIRLTIHKVLPSIFVLALDVFVAGDVTQIFVRLQDRELLPEVRFNKFIPRGALGGGYSILRTEAVLKRALIRWQQSLRGQVEACLGPYIKGYFMAQTHTSGSQLPAIDVWVLKGVPGDGEARKEWAKAAGGWLDSVGLDIDRFDGFKSESAAFIWSDESLSAEGSVHRLVILWEAFRKTVADPDHEEGHGNFAIREWSQDTLTSLLPAISIIHYVRAVKGNVEALRQRVFKSIRSGIISTILLINFFKLNNAVQEAAMHLDRLALEYEQDRDWIESDLKDVAELAANQGVVDGKPLRLSEFLVKVIDSQLDLSRKHLTLITTSFAQHLATRNMEAIYWLSIFVAIATIVGIIGWGNLLPLVIQALMWIQNRHL